MHDILYEIQHSHPAPATNSSLIQEVADVVVDAVCVDVDNNAPIL